MKLELFIMPTCPFCKRVLRPAKDFHEPIEIYDITSDPEAYKRLLTEGGEDQVPCLFIDGKPLYESKDILSWLKNN
ncbi:glutaredoxin family protein [Guggenheimella bovis]